MSEEEINQATLYRVRGSDDNILEESRLTFITFGNHQKNCCPFQLTEIKAKRNPKGKVENSLNKLLSKIKTSTFISMVMQAIHMNDQRFDSHTEEQNEW